MKSWRLARASERERVDWRRDQAEGLVSIMTVRREGGTSGSDVRTEGS